MVVQLPNGAGEVEIVSADAYSGPGDCYSRMHVNSNCVWYRVDGGEWQPSQFKSMHVARNWLLACETVNDVHEILGEQ